MSRSFRKNPIRGLAAHSEKDDKRLNTRRLRRKVKTVLGGRGGDLEDAVLPVMKEISDPWGMAKDGKMRFDPDRHPKDMRK